MKASEDGISSVHGVKFFCWYMQIKDRLLWHMSSTLPDPAFYKLPVKQLNKEKISGKMSEKRK